MYGRLQQQLGLTARGLGRAGVVSELLPVLNKWLNPSPCPSSSFSSSSSSSGLHHRHDWKGGAPPAAHVERARTSIQEIGQLLLGPSSSSSSLSLSSGRRERKADEAQNTPSTRNTFLPDGRETGARFDDFNLSPLSIRALHDILKFERMTLVQERTLNTILQGKDVVVKSSPGSGKTIAYLLPAIEAVLEAFSNTHENGGSILTVILCPTRELALQIFTEARTLLQFHSGIRMKVITGGFRIAKERVALQAIPCQILIATPGRLLDHLEKTEGFKQRLERMKLLIIDEADHVLDAGIRHSIEGILRYLPLFRQTLLFSATIPQEVQSIFKLALKEDHIVIDVTDTREYLESDRQVKQNYMTADPQIQFAVLYSILKEHVEQHPNYKVLVFCITARITSLMYQLFKELGFSCMEMHSKKGQMFRFHAYKNFRNTEGSMIMFTSDVSSHGIDYPNVTLVIQVGMPDRGGRYINRLGRTGRGQKDGESLLLLMPWEEYFIEKIKNFSIKKVSTPKVDTTLKMKILSILSSIDSTTRMHAYRTWMGYYLSVTDLPLTKGAIVCYANEFSSSIGFDKPPVLSRRLISKMGLGGVQGLRRLH